MNNDFEMIAGAGGGGGKAGGGAGSTPYVAPDTLFSRTIVSILDLLGEGQIGGLVTGDGQSILINDVPLLSANLTANFAGITWSINDGTQSQPYLPGFEETSTPFQQTSSNEVKNSTPFTFNVSSIEVDRVNIIIGIPQLYSEDTSTGDVYGTSVTWHFEVSVDGGAFVQVGDPVTVNGKCSSRYQRGYTITLPKPALTSYQVRVVRDTADVNTSNQQITQYLFNATYVDEWDEIIDSKLSYPNSAYIGMTVDAMQFSAIPKRSYMVSGLLIKLPSNYDPTTRTYTGTWDGQMTNVGVSDNPAWILYDLLTNDRYGLGNYIQAGNIDKWSLYTIAQYCDGMVNDGFGGQEPRFTINTCIANESEAYKLISDITSVFRGMTYWNGGMASFTCDMPTNPSMLFTPSNIVDGIINYAGASRDNIHTVVQVTWNDPNNRFLQQIEYVDNQELIAKYGVRKADVVAFGCTSRGQAHRVGQWMLYTEMYESDMISFNVGLDSSFVIPGQVVKLHDPYCRAGKRLGGRLVSVSAGLTSATLDAPVDIAQAGDVISIMMPDGTFADNTINEGVGTTNTVSWVTPLAQTPEPNAIWMLTETNLQPVLMRVLNVQAGKNAGEYTITGIEHNPSKYAAIENGTTLDVIPTVGIDPTVSPQPTNFNCYQTGYLMTTGKLGVKLHVFWSGSTPKYQVLWQVNNGSWTTVDTISPSMEIENALVAGVYNFQIFAITAFGGRSTVLSGTFTVAAKTTPPGVCTSLTATGSFRSNSLAWVNPSDMDLDHINVYASASNNDTTATLIGTSTGTTFTHYGLAGLQTVYYWVRAVNTSQIEGNWNNSMGTAATTLQVSASDVANQMIQESMLAPALESKVTAGDINATTLANYYAQTDSNSTAISGFDTRITTVENSISSMQGSSSPFVKTTDVTAIQNAAASAAVAQVNAAYLGSGGAIASQVNSLATQVNGQIATLQISAQSIQGLQAQYVVKIDNNGYVSGFGLASGQPDPITGKVTSEFTILADKFMLVQPNANGVGVNPVVPFAVNGNGEVVIDYTFIDKIVAANMSSPDGKFVIDLSNKYISIEV